MSCSKLKYTNSARTIDEIPFGEASWHSFKVRYTGEVTHASPSWKRRTYEVHTRDAMTVLRNMLASPDFNGKWNHTPYEEYVRSDDGQRSRRYSNVMSGRWAWRQATKVAADPETHGSMLVPIILGADKTTVSVATGQQEFHPLYISTGLVTNEMRRAHREAVLPLAFLHIPHAPRESEDDPEFREFKKQLYHASIAHILDPVRPAMSNPVVVRCPDGHFRRAIFEIGPFIADYPEQVLLATIVQNWCPKCLARPEELDSKGAPRFRDQAQPFTDQFPRADIHELLSPDLLHQAVKGTFKDHLVEWVQQYVFANNAAKDAKAIMDDIDRKISAVPVFPGLRRFHEGRNFKQWTGDDSKALMKVFVPAIVGHVPDRMVQAIVAFLDFFYLARRSSHTTDSLAEMEATLVRFHEVREVFRDEGIRDDFRLPRQHALVHYVEGIKNFGSLTGLCSSITESKHIDAVKEPWRHSSKNNPLIEILVKNTRRHKMAAARVEFGERGMLHGDVLLGAKAEMGLAMPVEPEIGEGHDGGAVGDDDALLDVIGVAGKAKPLVVEMGKRPAYTRSIVTLAEEVGQPRLQELVRRFLFSQIYVDFEGDFETVPLGDCPPFSGAVSVFHNARATFYAPSEEAGPEGMHSELFRSTPAWYGQYERRDTVLVQNGSEDDVMRGMVVGRVMLLMQFTHEDVRYSCALVEWFLPVDDEPDPVTGMWIVKPEMVHGRRNVGVIHLDCMVRACHLIGLYGHKRLDKDFHFADSHVAFKGFYLNRYADYHSHECGP
ncbi:hypothetical protein BV25DRAFT_1868788 [Artomyces pyxidatus]|uniref:Uncharacterized protein n=1 Tax=Artomyces pyxidatus TaxID=48021 RepID=A0ACB8TBI3_9AGAM|nr:hypothetical protein BV25DRAFT_1868788 [Artomyces pyxidatus]